MKERELRDRIHRDFQRDFVIHRDVRGVYLHGGEAIRADFLCFPREHLHVRGFDPVWFVIEAKHLDFARHESKRLYETVWQAITYRHSEFQIGAELVRPDFAAVLVTDSAPDYKNVCESAQRRRWEILTEFGLYANVGHLRLAAAGEWTLWFGQARAFDSVTGLNKVPRGLKRYVGSRSFPHPPPRRESE